MARRKHKGLTEAEQNDPRLGQLLTNIGHPPRLAKTGNRDRWSQKHADWVVTFLAECPSPQLAAKLLGCSTRNLYGHRDRDPEFRRAWDQAMHDGNDTLLGLAWEEAHGFGVRHVMTPTGEVMALSKDRNDKILTALINFRLGQRHIHEGELSKDDPPGTMILKVTPDQIGRLNREEQRQLTLLLNRLDELAPKTINGRAYRDPQKLEHADG